MALGDVVKDTKAPVQPLTLHDLLREKINKRDPIPVLTADMWVRASKVGKLCPREEVLADRREVVRTWRQDADFTMTLDHGTALHSMLQNKTYGKAGINIMRGRWRCTSCGRYHGGGLSPAEIAEQARVREAGIPKGPELEALLRRQNYQLDPAGWIEQPTTCLCGAEGAEHFTYQEFWFGDPDLGIGGSCDGIIRLPWREDFGLLEAKSISEMGAWGIRKAPEPHHVMQAHVYMHLIGLRWVMILYYDKGARGLSAQIPHYVEYNPIVIMELKSKLAATRNGIANPGSDLPARVCATRTCGRAKDCELSATCFSIG